MNPTPRLRFVERTVLDHINGGGKEVYRTNKILQQWFAYDIQYPTIRGEWKDVPTVEEKDVKTF